MSREEAAKAVVESHLGVKVRCHDDQSETGMHDLEFDLPNGGLAAVEVTAAEDQTWAGDVGALGKRSVLHDARLRLGWLVSMRPGGRVNTARKHLPDLLVRLEEAGMTDVSVFDIGSFEDHGTTDWLREALQEAHVQNARGGTAMRPGTIGITGAIRTAWLSQKPDDVVTFVEEFVGRRRSDAEKLGRSGADERHLFIWGGYLSEGWVALRALGLDIASLPTRAPDLPPEITHVWVAADAQRPSRIVLWTPDGGWEQAGTVS